MNILSVDQVSGNAGVPVAATFDEDAPPSHPPARCADAALWRIAFRLYQDHTAGGDGTCGRCAGAFPCLGARLARAGFATAVGERNDDSDYWSQYSRVLTLHGAAR